MIAKPMLNGFCFAPVAPDDLLPDCFLNSCCWNTNFPQLCCHQKNDCLFFSLSHGCRAGLLGRAGSAVTQSCCQCLNFEHRGVWSGGAAQFPDLALRTFHNVWFYLGFHKYGGLWAHDFDSANSFKSQRSPVESKSQIHRVFGPSIGSHTV